MVHHEMFNMKNVITALHMAIRYRTYTYIWKYRFQRNIMSNMLPEKMYMKCYGQGRKLHHYAYLDALRIFFNINTKVNLKIDRIILFLHSFGKSPNSTPCHPYTAIANTLVRLTDVCQKL